MRFLVLAGLSVSLPLFAGPAFRIPAETKQGNVVRIEASGLSSPDGLTATMQERTVRLFPAGQREALGLMPVPATLQPGSYAVSVRDKAGRTLFSSQVRVRNSRFPTQNIVATKAMKSLTPLPDEAQTIQAFNQIVSEKRFWSEPFLSPTPNCRNSPFGVRRLHNGKPTGNYHRGLDLRSPTGCPVKAAADGVVKVSRMFRRLGGTVGIDHGQGVLSMYLHLSKVAVPEGTMVHRGDVVGYVGATGFATGPHLHWQIQVNGVAVNPLQWAPGIKECAARPARNRKRPSSPRRSAGSPSR